MCVPPAGDGQQHACGWASGGGPWTRAAGAPAPHKTAICSCELMGGGRAVREAFSKGESPRQEVRLPRRSM